MAKAMEAMAEQAQGFSQGHSVESSSALAPTSRTRVKRLPKRASYDRDAIYSILDTALVCHVGFAIDGQPYVIPTLHVRIATGCISTARLPAGCSVLRPKARRSQSR